MTILGDTLIDEGVKKSEIVNWYLEQISEDIDSEEELIERKNVVDKVIHRLIHKVISFCVKIYAFLPIDFMDFQKRNSALSFN